MRYRAALFAWLALATAVPLAAQTVPPAGAVAPIEPARLAAAAAVIDRVWPLGTYKRMMDGAMTGIMDSMMASMFDMKASDVAALGGGKLGAGGDETLGQIGERADPAFRERLKITTDVMMGEMTTLMTGLEPEVRAALARAYARRFTAPQLADLERFFATPTGAAYAGQSMLIFTDPEMMKSMQSLTPAVLKAMPAILKKVEAATAHLPPPPKRKPAD